MSLTAFETRPIGGNSSWVGQYGHNTDSFVQLYITRYVLKGTLRSRPTTEESCCRAKGTQTKSITRVLYDRRLERVRRTLSRARPNELFVRFVQGKKRSLPVAIWENMWANCIVRRWIKYYQNWYSTRSYTVRLIYGTLSVHTFSAPVPRWSCSGRAFHRGSVRVKIITTLAAGISLFSLPILL